MRAQATNTESFYLCLYIMLMQWFRLPSLLAIGAVVAATSVNNLLNISSAPSVSIEESDLNDSDCFRSDVLHYAMSTLETCLSGCTEISFTFIDSSLYDGYVDTDMNQTNTTPTAFPNSKSANSNANIIILMFVWYLIFSTFQLHQIFLCVVLLAINTGRSMDINIIISFIAAGILYLSRGIWQEGIDNEEDCGTYDADIGDETESFNVGWGGRKFSFSPAKSNPQW